MSLFSKGVIMASSGRLVQQSKQVGVPAVKQIAKAIAKPVNKVTKGKMVNSGSFTNNLGSGLKSFGNPIVDNAAQGYASIAGMGANMANAVSAEAQQAAMNYNAAQASNANAITADYLGMQMRYNSAEAEAARAYNTAMYERALADNRALAKESRDWQEMMANTAYQRAVKDMQAAGINPILAYSQGGAAVPGGATASIGAPSSAATSIGLGSGVNASVGGYSGTGFQGSETLALIAAILGGLSTGLQAMDYGADTLGQIIDPGEAYKVKDKIGKFLFGSRLWNWMESDRGQAGGSGGGAGRRF